MMMSSAHLVALLLTAPASALVVGARGGSRQIGRAATPSCSIAVFGASGGTGSEAVFQALGRGENVNCLVRNPARLLVPAGSGGSAAEAPLRDDSLRVIQGDVTNPVDVAKVFEGGDVSGVVVALGGKTADVGESMLTDGTRNVIEACKAGGIKRIAVVTSIGAGDSENQAPFFFKVLMMTVMRKIFEDKNNQEKLFLDGPGSDLEFTVVRPGGLSMEPPNGIVNVIKGEAGSISRADVAAFCLDAVTKAEWPYIGQTPCISSDKGTSWVKDKGMPVGGNIGRK